ncbi:MAG: Na+/H+ antiporter NhaA [Actinobacteria bacterium HGW-Actinobacteria-7]|nr:MAG: Na+/H+ antiporter NhaA [Actinobacteria bacterium HGW-Actinobacteria-7]
MRPPRGSGAIRRAADSFSAFMQQETSGALVLLAATVTALALANTSLNPAYEAFWHEHAGFFLLDMKLDQSLAHWVDDALMALFFFVVGLEIKREFIVGELSSVRGAALPVVAALGGMLVPAGIYALVNSGGAAARGWGVPMATDIAFALGVLALLGSRIPTGLRVFLSALAIADDIGAIIVIALFYTERIATSWLLLALVPLLLLVVMNRMGIDQPTWYFVVAGALWFCVLNSGIHATIAGVVAAFAIPATARISPIAFSKFARTQLEVIEQADVPGAHTLEDYDQQYAALRIKDAAITSTAPLQRLEIALHPLTAFAVLPLFALVNAGIRLVDASGGGVHAWGMGVFLGLVVGKPLGVVGASWLAVRLGVVSLPSGVTWRHLVGAGLLAGIGFTMSLFVANLAFRTQGVQTEAKVAILAASVVAGVLGYLWLRYVAPPDAEAAV